jgi:hypothetical protein
MNKIAALRELVVALLQEHERDGTIPTNARFLFYELVQRSHISKVKTGARRPDQNLHDALIDVREDGQIPWDWIVDETRSLDDYTGYATVLEGVLARLSYIKLDCWRDDAPMILTESRSLAGVLRDIVREYRARISSTNGQCGGFLRTDIAPQLRPGMRVLYLGDYDLSGNLIEANTRRVLAAEPLDNHIVFDRIAQGDADRDRRRQAVGLRKLRQIARHRKALAVDLGHFCRSPDRVDVCSGSARSRGWPLASKCFSQSPITRRPIGPIRVEIVHIIGFSRVQSLHAIAVSLSRCASGDGQPRLRPAASLKHSREWVAREEPNNAATIPQSMQKLQHHSTRLCRLRLDAIDRSTNADPAIDDVLDQMPAGA